MRSLPISLRMPAASSRFSLTSRTHTPNPTFHDPSSHLNTSHHRFDITFRHSLTSFSILDPRPSLYPRSLLLFPPVVPGCGRLRGERPATRIWASLIPSTSLAGQAHLTCRITDVPAVIPSSTLHLSPQQNGASNIPLLLLPSRTRDALPQSSPRPSTSTLAFPPLRFPACKPFEASNSRATSSTTAHPSA